MVEVSGSESAGGEILAWRIERKSILFQPGITMVEVKGEISSLDTIQMFFNIGSLLVDYASATKVEGSISDGLRVEVKGTLVAGRIPRPAWHGSRPAWQPL